MSSSPPATTSSARTLEAGIRRFVTQVNAAYAEIPGFGTLSYPEARRAAERVRAPWRAGGPRMAQQRELEVASAAGTIRIRVYDPGPPGLKPGLVYLHGGGWTLFSLDTHDRVMREYAARAGISVVGVDYPLAPEVKFPVALHQTVAVVRWLGAHGPDVGVDPAHLAVGGDSAGANLAIAAALLLRDAGEGQRLAALLLNYGAFDTACTSASEAAFGGAGFMLTPAEMRSFWSNYLRSPADAEDPLACPGRARLADLPSVFLTIPECDILAEQSLGLVQRLARAGVPARSVCYPGTTHSFLEAVSVSPIADRAFADGSAWLRSVLAGARPETGSSVAEI